MRHHGGVNPNPGPAVLLVEDNLTDRKLVRILLEMEGCAVRTAGSAEEALRLLGGFRPSLLLVDIDLPGISGLELARRLRADPAWGGMPIFAMSSTAGADAPARAAAAGCSEFMAKPVDVRAFSAAIARLIRASRPSHPGV